MLFTILTIAGTVGVTTAANRYFFRLKNRPNSIDTNWHNRPILEGAAWDEFLRCIKDDCKGWKLAHALIQAVFDNGFRFSCAQIYQVTEKYNDRFKVKGSNKLKDLMKYGLTVDGEAQEKVEKLILETDERLLLNGRT